jgi:type II secretory pathway component GspD/PulD (secretin)
MFKERERFTSYKPAAAPVLFDTGQGTGLFQGKKFHNRGGNAAFLYEVPSAYFDFLSTKGKARIRSNATVAVMHDETAVLQTVDTILYYAVQDADGGDLSNHGNAIDAAPDGGYRPNGVVINPDAGQTDDFPKNRTVVGTTAERGDLGGSLMGAEDTGVFVEVTPSIATNLIGLDIDMRILNHIGSADNGRPIIVRRTANTHVKATSGQEVVMGGLVYETALNTTRKFPILGSIPVVGYLFGGEIKQTQKRLVVVAVKPTVITDFSGMTAKDRAVVDKAKGEKPIRLPRHNVKFQGDPLPIN